MMSSNSLSKYRHRKLNKILAILKELKHGPYWSLIVLLAISSFYSFGGADCKGESIACHFSNFYPNYVNVTSLMSICVILIKRNFLLYMCFQKYELLVECIKYEWQKLVNTHGQAWDLPFPVWVSITVGVFFSVAHCPT